MPWYYVLRPLLISYKPPITDDPMSPCSMLPPLLLN
jgi:hypothetical protein